MKTGTVLWMTIIVLAFSFTFAGCASMKRKQAANTEDILIAAGFTSKVPDTPEAWDRFRSLEPLKIIQTKKDGQVVYVYPDPYHCNCVMVGNEQQYAEYRRLALQKKISDQNLQAAQMWQNGPPYDGYWWW